MIFADQVMSVPWWAAVLGMLATAAAAVVAQVVLPILKVRHEHRRQDEDAEAARRRQREIDTVAEYKALYTQVNARLDESTEQERRCQERLGKLERREERFTAWIEWVSPQLKEVGIVVPKTLLDHTGETPALPPAEETPRA